jgi:hypothetical protein
LTPPLSGYPAVERRFSSGGVHLEHLLVGRPKEPIERVAALNLTTGTSGALHGYVNGASARIDQR